MITSLYKLFDVVFGKIRLTNRRIYDVNLFRLSLHYKKERMIKALFFDIDGTLVSFHTHRIPRSTVESLEKAKKKGLKIFISTGRPLTYINNLDDIKSLIDGYITTNGAYILVGDKVIACHTIPKEDVCAMMKFSDERKFPCILVGESAALVYNTTREIEEFFHRLLDLNSFATTHYTDDTDYYSRGRGRDYALFTFL